MTDRYGRYICTPKNPWTPEKGKRVAHTNVREIRDYGETRRMRCEDCGKEWTEELPQ